MIFKCEISLFLLIFIRETTANGRNCVQPNFKSVEGIVNGTKIMPWAVKIQVGSNSGHSKPYLKSI